MIRNKLILTLLLLCRMATAQDSDHSSPLSFTYTTAVYSAIFIDRGDDANTNEGALYHDLNLQYLIKPKWGLSSGLNYLYSTDPRAINDGLAFSEKSSTLTHERVLKTKYSELHRLSLTLGIFYKFETRWGLQVIPQVGLQLQHTNFSIPFILEDIFLSPDSTSYMGRNAEIIYEPIWNAQFYSRIDASMRVYEKISLGVSGIFTLSSGALGERPLQWTPSTQKLAEEVYEFDSKYIGPYFNKKFQQSLKVTQSSVCINIRYDL